jgi:RNA polymerase subunit RPABC4/transcription elongation factor Spt4
VYPTSGSSSDLGNNFGNGRWRRLYTLNSPSVSSDERLKENIIDIPYGLDYINLLEPKQYNLKRVLIRGCETCKSYIEDDITECTVCQENDATANIVDNLDVTGEEEGVVNFGFIAQDLISTPPEPDTDIALVDYNEDSDEYGVRYNELIAPLVKAVQELSAKNDELQLRIEALEG